MRLFEGIPFKTCAATVNHANRISTQQTWTFRNLNCSGTSPTPPPHFQPYWENRPFSPCVSKQRPADGLWRIWQGVSPDRVRKTRFTPSESSAGHGLPPQRPPLNSVQRMVCRGYCEGSFPDTVCWTRLRNTWFLKGQFRPYEGLPAALLQETFCPFYHKEPFVRPCWVLSKDEIDPS